MGSEGGMKDARGDRETQTSDAGQRTVMGVLPLPALSLAVAVLIVTAASLLPSPPGYLTVDDYEQDMYARGAVYDTPGLLMPYTFAPVSMPLCLLYLFAPSVPWYPLLLLALATVSTAVALDTALSARHRTVRAVLAAAVTCCGAALVACFTYTAVAFAAVAAGAVVIIRHAGLARPGPLRASDVGAYTLVAAGFSLRPESGLAAAASLAPFLVWAIAFNRNRVTLLRAAGVAACMAGCMAAGLAAYRLTPGWEDYYPTLNTVRSVVDYPRVNHSFPQY